MRLLITGAGGQLGRELTRRASDHAVSVVGLTQDECDITDRRAVGLALDEHRPTVLVNCAAWTDVDGAESHGDEAYVVNAAAPGILAGECSTRDILLLHLSTDYVFPGDSNAPIPETAVPAPLSVYGASKLAGEQAIRAATARYLIVRTSGLYGCDGPNFVLKVLRRAASGAELRVVTDQLTAPTWTAHLAPALMRLLELDVTGTYHLTNSGAASWYDVAALVVAIAGYTASTNRITAADLAAPARRPHHALLDNLAWRQLGEPPLPPWEAGVRGYMDELRDRGRLR